MEKLKKKYFQLKLFFALVIIGFLFYSKIKPRVIKFAFLSILFIITAVAGLLGHHLITSAPYSLKETRVVKKNFQERLVEKKYTNNTNTSDNPTDSENAGDRTSDNTNTSDNPTDSENTGDSASDNTDTPTSTLINTQKHKIAQTSKELNAQQVDDLREKLLIILDKQPQNATTLKNLYLLEINTNNHQEAQKYLEQALLIDPSFTTEKQDLKK